jgi:hypothetical protein
MSDRVFGVPGQLRALSRTLTDVAPELDRVATRLTSARLPDMPPGVAAVVAGTLSQVGASMRRAAAAVTREGLDVQRRVIWLEIAGSASTLETMHGPRPPGLWSSLPELGFGPPPQPGPPPT